VSASPLEHYELKSSIHARVLLIADAGKEGTA
jgi:hypothetical protein